MRNALVRSVGAGVLGLAACALLAAPAQAATTSAPTSNAARPAAVQPAQTWQLYYVYSTNQACTSAGQWLVGQGRASTFQCVYKGVWDYELWILA